MIGRLILIIGTAAFLHSAYSTYEVMAVRKSIGISQRDVPTDIVIETLVSLVVLLFGVALTASPLRDIAWSRELQKRSIDESDARPGFMALNHRGPALFGSTGEK